MRRQTLLTTMAMACLWVGYAQNVGINGTGSAPDASAMLDVASTNRGLLIPRVTEAQRNAISNPATSLLVFQSNGVPGYYYYNGSAWQPLAQADNMGNHVATQNINLGVNFISRTGDAGVGLRFDLNNNLVYRALNTLVPNGTIGDRLRVDRDGGFVAIGDLGIGVIPASGLGVRMMWYPFKAAFRAGGVDESQWNDVNVGFYSAAMGNNTTATAFCSFAMGDGARSGGVGSVAFGSNVVASGTVSFVSGASSTASGFSAVAMGFTSRATNQGSVAIGYRNSSTSDYAIAIGHRAVARNTGAVVLSDASTTDSTLSTANNQFMTRFAGGYRFFTNATRTVGVSLAASGNSWASISDSSRKENFVPARHEDFLENLASLRLGSWNYIGQPEAGYRHYGPMAQEIFAAYGRDALGTIGNDTTLASADMDGLMMILIQGLEKRTSQLQQSNQQLQTQLAAVLQHNDVLQARLAQVDALQAKIEALTALLADEKTGTTVLQQP